MKPHPDVTGRRERAKQDKRNHIAAATDLLAELIAPKVSGRYDEHEYQEHEEYVRDWSTDALSYAKGSAAAA